VLAQVRCFKKWENSNCIISYFVNNIHSDKHYMWTRSSKTLVGKLNKHENDRAVKNFYWEDLKKNSFKAKSYEDNNFEKTTDYLKLCYEYPEYSYGFYWLLKARSGYKLDARVVKAAKIIDRLCPNYCSCCKSKCQTIEHWLVKCPYFNDLRDEFSSILTVIINQFSTRTTTASSTNIETSNLNNSDNILDSNFIDNNNLVNNIVYNNSSVCKKKYLNSCLEEEP